VTRGLLVIDIQRDYFPDGAYPLTGADEAAVAARQVLEVYRNAHAPVVHLKHLWDCPDATFMIPASAGVEIHPLVEPEGELLIEKPEPNGFFETSLLQALKERQIDDLGVIGMMSSMCVDATVRAAVEHGFAVTVVHDACAVPELEFLGTVVPGDSVQAEGVSGVDHYAHQHRVGIAGRPVEPAH
jgi:nicotinamidase-related amidase